MSRSEPSSPSPNAALIVVTTLGAVLFLGYWLSPSVNRDLSGLPVFRCHHNLTIIGSALFRYHDVYRSFPPPFVPDENGTPVHSWRVLILPFLAEAGPARRAEFMNLFETYRFDEPWNGPHNRRLAERAPDVYRCPSAGKDQRNCTCYLAVVGAETAWPRVGSASTRDIRDDPFTTLLCVEVDGPRIRWTQPDDLNFDRMTFAINSNTGAGIGSRHEGAANVLCCDGTARIIAETVTPQTIRNALTIAGNETIKGDEL
jgi:hypothetical protein